MATQIFQDTRKKRHVLNQMARNTLEFIERQNRIQRMFPKEVYGGWLQENRKRRAAGGKLGWFSTGEGVRSYSFKVNSTDNEESIAFTYNKYMMFADLGVGKGRPKEDVDRAKKAKFGQRYIEIWDPPSGRTHRPNMMMQWYSLRSRMEAFLQDYYGREAIAYMYTFLSDLDDIEIE